MAIKNWHEQFDTRPVVEMTPEQRAEDERIRQICVSDAVKSILQTLENLNATNDAHRRSIVALNKRCDLLEGEIRKLRRDS